MPGPSDSQCSAVPGPFAGVKAEQPWNSPARGWSYEPLPPGGPAPSTPSRAPAAAEEAAAAGTTEGAPATPYTPATPRTPAPTPTQAVLGSAVPMTPPMTSAAPAPADAAEAAGHRSGSTGHKRQRSGSAQAGSSAPWHSMRQNGIPGADAATNPVKADKASVPSAQVDSEEGLICIRPQTQNLPKAFQPLPAAQQRQPPQPSFPAPAALPAQFPLWGNPQAAAAAAALPMAQAQQFAQAQHFQQQQYHQRNAAMHTATGLDLTFVNGQPEWRCSNCGVPNFLERTQCRMCFQVRGDGGEALFMDAGPKPWDANGQHYHHHGRKKRRFDNNRDRWNYANQNGRSRSAAPQRGVSRGRSQGPQRGHSQGPSRGYSRAPSRGRSQGPERNRSQAPDRRGWSQCRDQVWTQPHARTWAPQREPSEAPQREPSQGPRRSYSQHAQRGGWRSASQGPERSRSQHRGASPAPWSWDSSQWSGGTWTARGSGEPWQQQKQPPANGAREGPAAQHQKWQEQDHRGEGAASHAQAAVAVPAEGTKKEAPKKQRSSSSSSSSSSSDSSDEGEAKQKEQKAEVEKPAAAASCQAEIPSSEPPEPPDAATKHLSVYGFGVADAKTWRPVAAGAPARPEVHLELQDHVELDGHTYYMIECSLSAPGLHQLEWVVQLRLAELKKGLFVPVREDQKEAYHKHFKVQFADKTSFRKTLVNLKAWIQCLANLINTRNCSPSLVSRVLQTLEAPEVQAAAEPQEEEEEETWGGWTPAVEVPGACAATTEEAGEAEATPPTQQEQPSVAKGGGNGELESEQKALIQRAVDATWKLLEDGLALDRPDILVQIRQHFPKIEGVMELLREGEPALR